MERNKAMNIIGKTVIHKTLGEGIVTEYSGNKISVRFSSRTSKFVFPSAFESFLSFADPAFQAGVLTLLEKEKAEEEEEQKAAAEKKKLREQRTKEQKSGIRTSANNSMKHIERKWERKERRKNEGLRTATTIRVEDGYLFDRSVDILNECFGKDYDGWQRGGYNLNYGGKRIMVWFPKMAVYEYGIEKSQSSTTNVINTMSADGKTIREYFPDKERIVVDDIIRITFAKFPGELYRYVGTFVADTAASTAQERIYRKIATEADLTPWKKK